MGKIGARIENLSQLRDLAQRRGSVVSEKHSAFKRPKPAAFALGMPGAYLVNVFEVGLYEYEPEWDKALMMVAEGEGSNGEDDEQD